MIAVNRSSAHSQEDQRPNSLRVQLSSYTEGAAVPLLGTWKTLEASQGTLEKGEDNPGSPLCLWESDPPSPCPPS